MNTKMLALRDAVIETIHTMSPERVTLKQIEDLIRDYPGVNGHRHNQTLRVAYLLSKRGILDSKRDYDNGENSYGAGKEMEIGLAMKGKNFDIPDSHIMHPDAVKPKYPPRIHRFFTETQRRQIIAQVRAAVAAGKTMPEACAAAGIHSSSYYKWSPVNRSSVNKRKITRRHFPYDRKVMMVREINAAVKAGGDLVKECALFGISSRLYHDWKDLPPREPSTAPKKATPNFASEVSAAEIIILGVPASIAEAKRVYQQLKLIFGE